MTFTSLGLSPNLCLAAERAGWLRPTPIQEKGIPFILQGRDVLATAATGSGKTAAYGLGLLHLLQSRHVLQTSQSSASSSPSASHISVQNKKAPHSTRRNTSILVIVPTRELAVQVGQVFKELVLTSSQSVSDSQANSQHLKVSQALRVATVFGGVSINPQMLALRGGADIVVATPGRLLDLVDHNALQLDSVAHLVLDEVDRLLDLGFMEELNRVLTLLPSKRQNLWFSATFDDALQPLADSMLREPAHIAIAGPATNDSAHPAIQQRAIVIDEKKRTLLLRHFFTQEKWKQVLVFVATRYASEHVANKLYQAGIYATALHGEMSQGARQTVLQEFKDARWEVLVTTDLAARGIDIAKLPTVVNYDLPRSATDYIHRMGRTGRAGEKGEVLSFVTVATLAHWKLIQKRQGAELSLEVMEGFAPTDTPPPTPKLNDGTGGIKGRRLSKKDKLRGLKGG
ncbi:MAG: DEAD/DEAH box helicase [Betaproteobacteria bacterium]|nr:DEAD/DEAH box helicase [Betaproteobacteria bacterium]